VSARRIWIGCAVALFGIVCVLPGAYMFGVSFLSPDGGLTFSNYTRLVSEPRQRELLRTTIALAAAASAIASMIGIPLGFCLSRVALPRVALLRLGLLVPLVIPPYVLALVWIFLTGYSSTSYSLPGAALVLGVGFYPLLMLASEAGFGRVDASLEEAALLITNPGKVFVRITVPLVAPLVAAAALLVFALAVAEFSVPGLLRVRVFTTEVFTAFAALYDFGRATALAVPLLVVTLVAALLAKWSAGDRLLTPSTTWRPVLLSQNPRQKALAGVFAVGVIVAGTVVPVAVLAAHAQSVMPSVIPSWPAIRDSILLSLIAATSIVVLGMLIGYARGRMHSRGGMLADLILISVFAVPSTVVGVGIIGLWNRPAIPIGLYASPITIVLGYMARFLPLAVFIIAASVRQVPLSSEEAAEMSGVSWLRGFWGIVIPQIRGGIIAAWVAVFVFTFGELGTTILVTPPGESTLPVRVYTLIANAREGEIATLALLQLFATVVPMALFGLKLGRSENRP
jgi:iron(III) transport system permease protein